MGLLEGVAPSLRLYLHLTMKCNLSCSYCYGKDRRSDTMAPQVGRDAIDFFLDRSRHLMLQFFGGEPLLQLPLMKELVAHAEAAAAARRRALTFVVVTNGTLLTPEVVDYCAAHRIDVSLSLDGGPESQDAGRRYASGRGSFAAVERHLGHLLERIPQVHVVTVITPDNVAHLGASVRWMLDRGFRSIALSCDYGDPRLAEVVGELERQLDLAAEAWAEHVARGGRAWVDLFDDGTINPYARGRCGLASRDFSVDPGGRIYPCCCFVDHERYPLGSIYGGIDEGLLAEFQAEKQELDRRIDHDHAGCPEGGFCRKGCACTNLTAAGRPSVILPVTCEVARAVARVQERLRDRRAAAPPTP